MGLKPCAGDRVVVISKNKYSPFVVGLFGTVCNNYMGSVSVKLDDAFNGNSERGLYYFKERDLRLIDIPEPKPEQTMEGAVKLMDGNYRIADVQFIDGNNKSAVYAYACYDEGIYVDDICVVKSAHHGFGLAKVVRLRAKTDEEITREIVCKADFSAYDKRVVRRVKQAELMKRMAERASKLQELSMYTLLAESDPEMAKLLEEYREVQ